jgi:malonyl-CoA O-methyltransferase
MEILEAFSKFAYEYKQYNVIQKEVAKKLLSSVPRKEYTKILDLGAGDGEVYRNLQLNKINFKEFIALDFSKEMLEIHPNDEFIKKIEADFNHPSFYSLFKKNEFDLLLSSSALQWSDELEQILRYLSIISTTAYFSFFTSNTFKTLHQVAGITSPICSKEKILDSLDALFEYEMEIEEYRLSFESVHEMLTYIKNSGVSGGTKQLGYREMKKLILTYPLDYLEFEVIFVKNVKKKILEKKSPK